MPGLKNRYMDQTKRLINRKIRLEICAVDDVEWHESPNDHRFNTVTVIMRDRAKRVDSSKSYYRAKLPVLQNFQGGHHQGANWNPRKGDLVYVLFYKEREGIVLGNVWSWAEYPVCRPTPYDIADKGGQWTEPYQNPVTGDFLRQPYPSGKKPYCFRWFHGPVTGSTGPGRDWAWMFDYCHLGDSSPSCKDCKNIDSIISKDNHFFKFYSRETESRKAYPGRGVYHAPGGAYWLFDSFDAPDGSYVSEFCTEGKGFWTIQGAVDDILKGHIRHHPEGDVEIHSATDPQDDTGTRCTVAAPNSSLFNFAWEAIHFVTGAFRRILKDGKIEDSSPTEIKLTAPDIVLNGDVEITGSCTHGSCSCEGEFVALDGVAGGQTICGGTEAGDDLELQSTSNATKGCIKLNCGSGNVDPSLTYNADCPCFIETADLQLAVGCAVNPPHAFWMQVRQSTNVRWGMHLQPLGGDILIGNATGGSKLGVNVSPAYNLDVLDSMRLSGSNYPGYFLQSNLSGSKLWVIACSAGDLLIRNATDKVNLIHIYNSGGVSVGSTVHDPGANNLYVTGDVSADSFTDRTPAFTGDALAEIRKIPLGVTDQINHENLPNFIRRQGIDPITGEEVEERNIGNTISLLTAAVRQLINKIDVIETDLSIERAKQSMKINDSEPPTDCKPQLFMSSGDLKIKLPDGTVKTISTN